MVRFSRKFTIPIIHDALLTLNDYFELLINPLIKICFGMKRNLSFGVNEIEVCLSAGESHSRLHWVNRFLFNG